MFNSHVYVSPSIPPTLADAGQPPTQQEVAAFHKTLTNGDDLAALAQLQRQSALARTRDTAARTPLHLAAAGGCEAVVDALLSHGVDVLAADSEGNTALHAAVSGDQPVTNTSVVHLLAKDRPVLCNQPNHGGKTPLMLATRDDTVAQRLLAEGADVNAKDKSGLTPLMHAARYGHNKTLESLLYIGAEVRATDQSGWTPLMHAAKYGNGEVTATLLNASSDVKATNQQGQTALMLALESGKMDAVRLLSEETAKPILRDAHHHHALGEYAIAMTLCEKALAIALGYAEAHACRDRIKIALERSQHETHKTHKSREESSGLP
jgi:ankyrin repeat protein